jgi:hypothetical protein
MRGMPVAARPYKPGNLHDPDLLDLYYRNNWGEFSNSAVDVFEENLRRLWKESRYRGVVI